METKCYFNYIFETATSYLWPEAFRIQRQTLLRFFFFSPHSQILCLCISEFGAARYLLSAGVQLILAEVRRDGGDVGMLYVLPLPMKEAPLSSRRCCSFG